MAEYSKAARRFISAEISHLFHDKGYDLNRAVAAAIEQAREKGFKVPPRPNPTLALVNPIGKPYRDDPRRVILDPIPETDVYVMGTAVYEIAYRHADDGYDYVHTFEKPERVKVVIIDPRRVMLVGDGIPIMGMFKKE